MRNWYEHLATFGPVGYLPLPGTMGSLVSFPFVYLVHYFLTSFFVYGASVAILFIISVNVINRALITLNRTNDPSEIVLDEYIGLLITFWGIPFTIKWGIVGFFLFRIFDITKIGLSSFEKLPLGYGIVMDDVAAGIVSNLVLQLCMYLS
jgi:phosphatidylglycerophosphatase A